MVKNKNEKINIDMAMEEALLDHKFVVTMPIVPGSQDAMEKLHKKYHVIVASSRPDKAIEATKRWLKKHFKYHEYVNTRDIGKHNIGLDVLSR